MRREPLIAIILFILMLAGAVHFIQITASSSFEDGRLSISMRRYVQVNQWGATIVNDEITFTNKGEMEIKDLSYGFPSKYLKDLKLVKPTSFEGPALAYELEKDGEYAWIRYKFDRVVKPGEAYRFNVTQVFSDRIRYQENRYNFTFFDAPTFDVQVDSYNVTFYFPSDATLLIPENFTFTETRYQGYPAMTAIYTPLAPYSSKDFSMRYSSISTELVKIYWAKREIALGPTGSLEISDSYCVRNLGVLLSVLTIDVARGADNVIAYDEGGKIWLNPQKGERMTVTPRHGTFESNESFTFTLKYRVPADNYIERSSWRGEYHLNMNIITPQRWIIDELEVEITLPRGAEIEYVNKEPFKVVNDLYETRVTLEFQGVTPLHDLTLLMDYNIHPLWVALRPLGWSIIIGACIASLSIMIKSGLEKREEEREVAKAPKDVIRRFVDFQDEKVALTAELDEIVKRLSSGRISKKEYRRKRKAIEKRLSQLDRSLSGLKAELKSIDPRYGELISVIERGEAEITAVRASIRQLYSQYRAGKISRETFTKISMELEKRMGKAKGELERALITLREEAR